MVASSMFRPEPAWLAVLPAAIFKVLRWFFWLDHPSGSSPVAGVCCCHRVGISRFDQHQQLGDAASIQRAPLWIRAVSALASLICCCANLQTAVAIQPEPDSHRAQLIPVDVTQGPPYSPRAAGAILRNTWVLLNDVEPGADAERFSRLTANPQARPLSRLIQ